MCDNTSLVPLQFRLRILVMIFFTLCLVLLFVVKLGSCAGFQFSWLGLAPMQVSSKQA